METGVSVRSVDSGSPAVLEPIHVQNDSVVTGGAGEAAGGVRGRSAPSELKLRTPEDISANMKGLSDVPDL